MDLNLSPMSHKIARQRSIDVGKGNAEVGGSPQELVIVLNVVYAGLASIIIARL